MKRSLVKVDGLISVIPGLGGVEPANSGRGAILGLVKEFGLTQQKVDELAKSLVWVKKAAQDVGLDLTVNDLKRAAQAMAEIQKANLEDGFTSCLLPPIYKGVSFNPETFQRGLRSEWLVILDFYSLLRQLVSTQSETELPLQAAILDAGLYWVVNLLGESGIELTESSSQAAAQQMIDLLINSCTEARFEQVIQTNQVRNAYLRAIASQFPANHTPPVFSLMDVWRDPEFPGFLAEAIKLFCDNRVLCLSPLGAVSLPGKWWVIRPVAYERYMTYSPWVTPLVAAEQALLAKKSGFRANLAPTTEAVWNQILDQMCKKLRLEKYVIWMYVRRLGARLSYGAIPSFADDIKTIAAKLEHSWYQSPFDENLGGLITGLIRPFMDEDWFNEAQSCLKHKDNFEAAKLIFIFTSHIEEDVTRLLKKDQSIPSIPLENMAWLMRFPQGAC